MKSEELKKRTKKYAIEIIKLVQSLPKDRVADVIGKQLLRSGTSVGANYRSACRARSKADFISKMKIVEEEADESSYWLELIEEAKIYENEVIKPVMKETTELLSIAVASIQTARKHLWNFSYIFSLVFIRQSSFVNLQYPFQSIQKVIVRL